MKFSIFLTSDIIKFDEKIAFSPKFPYFFHLWSFFNIVIQKYSLLNLGYALLLHGAVLGIILKVVVSIGFQSNSLQFPGLRKVCIGRKFLKAECCLVINYGKGYLRWVHACNYNKTVQISSHCLFQINPQKKYLKDLR